MERCFFNDREFSSIHHSLLNYSDDLKRILNCSSKHTFFYDEVKFELSIVKGLLKKFKP